MGNVLARFLRAFLFLVVGLKATSAVGLQLGAVDPIVPGPNLPEQSYINTSNNNLDVIEHNGQLFFVWRTAPSHFASGKTILQVMRREGDGWVFELALETGKDLREPRFLSLNGELFLYFAELGTNPIAFQPGKTFAVKRDIEGAWGESFELFGDGFIPWRINWVNGSPIMIGYKGGESIYQNNQSALQLMLLTTEDGIDWVPAFNDSGIVLESGLSETDFVLTNEYLVAVGRNEAGDEDGWGSKICRAPLNDLAAWDCVADRRKFDSPLMILSDGQPYLIARRQVMYGGNYDLQWRRLSFNFQNILYQAFYWLSPKRCAVWKVNQETFDVEWIEDLPSAGDTCFPSAISKTDGSVDIYNYTSDYENGLNWSWVKGQLSPTKIYKINLTL